MLDSQTIAIVKSTIPVLVETGPKLTGYFYERMFKHNPELKDIFNLSHQQSGAQREALFGAICAYASNIENLSAILPAVERIAQKHASFNIQPEQYNIVGHHLLATIDELLHPGTEVIEAWGKAYQVLANVFIQREAQIYQQTADEQGGWKGLREFRIVKKQKESDVITSFELAPVDNKPVVDYAAGQYIAVYLQGGQLENQEIRQYSLTRSPNGKTYRIAVKREDQGKASNYLHNVIQEGDILSLAPPYGDFFIDVKPEVSVALISAGVGLTPMLGMLNTLKAQNHQGNIYWLHAAENGAAAAFRNEVTEITDAMANVRQQVWYNQPNSDDIAGVDYHHQGLMQLDMSEHRLFSPDMQYYFCGPVAFMQYIAKQLTQRGVKTEQLHYECFGPHKIV